MEFLLTDDDLVKAIDIGDDVRIDKSLEELKIAPSE